MPEPVLPSGLPDRFAAVMAALYRALGVATDKDRSSAAVLYVLYLQLHRKVKRLTALFVQFRAGTLKPPRRREARPASAVRNARPPYAKLPRSAGWLLRLMKTESWRAAGCGFALRDLLAEPEMAAFLAAAPQAKRLLRPILGMLSGGPLPEVLRLPPRTTPPRVRAATPTPPRAPPPPRPRLPGDVVRYGWRDANGKLGPDILGLGHGEARRKAVRRLAAGDTKWPPVPK